MSDTHDVVAAVDIDHFAGDPGRHRATEEHGGVSDLAGIDVAAEWRAFRVVFQHSAEIRDAAGGESLNWTSADSVDADVACAEVLGEVTSAGFECRFGYAHHVVTGDDFLGAVVRH